MATKLAISLSIGIAALCLFHAVSLSGAQESEPATSKPADEPWRLIVSHPSLDKDELYLCFLTIPKQTPVNEDGGVVVVLVNRKGEKVGVVPMQLGMTVQDERMIECRLGPELIKRSYFLFRTRAEAGAARTVKLTFGDQPTVRVVDGVIRSEPIP